MSKRSINFAGMGGKHGRYANSVQGLVDSMRAVGMTDAEIRAELEKMQAAKVQAAVSAIDDVFGPRDPNATYGPFQSPAAATPSTPSTPALPEQGVGQ